MEKANDTARPARKRARQPPDAADDASLPIISFIARKVVLASTSQEGNAMAEDQDLLTKLEYRIDSFLRPGRQEAPSSNKQHDKRRRDRTFSQKTTSTVLSMVVSHGTSSSDVV
jgi:hypothetical protein